AVARTATAKLKPQIVRRNSHPIQAKSASRGVASDSHEGDTHPWPPPATTSASGGAQTLAIRATTPGRTATTTADSLPLPPANTLRSLMAPTPDGGRNPAP